MKIFGVGLTLAVLRTRTGPTSSPAEPCRSPRQTARVEVFAARLMRDRQTPNHRLRLVLREVRLVLASASSRSWIAALAPRRRGLGLRRLLPSPHLGGPGLGFGGFCLLPRLGGQSLGIGGFCKRPLSRPRLGGQRLGFGGFCPRPRLGDQSFGCGSLCPLPRLGGPGLGFAGFCLLPRLDGQGLGLGGLCPSSAPRRPGLRLLQLLQAPALAPAPRRPAIRLRRLLLGRAPRRPELAFGGQGLGCGGFCLGPRLGGQSFGFGGQSFGFGGQSFGCGGFCQCPRLGGQSFAFGGQGLGCGGFCLRPRLGFQLQPRGLPVWAGFSLGRRAAGGPVCSVPAARACRSVTSAGPLRKRPATNAAPASTSSGRARDGRVAHPPKPDKPASGAANNTATPGYRLPISRIVAGTADARACPRTPYRPTIGRSRRARRSLSFAETLGRH